MVGNTSETFIPVFMPGQLYQLMKAYTTFLLLFIHQINGGRIKEGRSSLFDAWLNTERGMMSTFGSMMSTFGFPLSGQWVTRKMMDGGGNPTGTWIRSPRWEGDAGECFKGKLISSLWFEVFVEISVLFFYQNVEVVKRGKLSLKVNSVSLWVCQKWLVRGFWL